MHESRKLAAPIGKLQEFGKLHCQNRSLLKDRIVKTGFERRKPVPCHYLKIIAAEREAEDCSVSDAAGRTVGRKQLGIRRAKRFISCDDVIIVDDLDQWSIGPPVCKARDEKTQ
ncbi:MAG: hypothetical protein CML23_01670 [Rhizobiaceae bacterium]|nr:hypothetical protein [Rhizobiaceae bacterium]